MLLGECNEAGVTFLLRSLEGKVLRYCRVESLNEALSTLVVEMAVARYRRQATGTATEQQTIASVSDGDQTVSYHKPHMEQGGAGDMGFSQAEKDALNAWRKAW